MRNTWALYKKELRSYFGSPLFYVVTAVFLVICGYYFHSDLVYFVEFGFGIDILTNYFQLLFVDIARDGMLITVPLLTMGAFAEERKSGTIELLYTFPLRDGEIFAGKFLACFTVFAVMIANTAAYPWYLYSIQPYPWQVVIPAYVGLLLLGSVFISAGLFISSLTESQVVAAVSTLGVLLLFRILSWNEAAASQEVMGVLKALSTFDRFVPFARGVIDSGGVVFFGSATVLFSMLTLRSMESRRWRGRR